MFLGWGANKTDFGHFLLEDPATGRLANNHKDAVPADRLILYEDLLPQEQPLNPDDEVWIEINSNEVATGLVEGIELDTVLSNSFGFGGTNASIALSKYIG